ncbi:MAG: glycosyltransferase [Acetobacteraceae bacterium]
MNGTPRVSVIMPSYNHAPFVGKAIDSVLGQSFQDFELIIADDGSTDGSVEVIRGFDDPRIDLNVFPENHGACKALNDCVTRARGEYVAVLNSDDFFLPGKLARQVAYLDGAPEVGAVFGLARFVDERGAVIGPGDGVPTPYFSTAPADRFGWLREFFLRGNALCHPSVMIRRRLYDELGLYDGSLRQVPDLDMWIRVCARYPIVVLAEELICFRILDGFRNTSAPSPAVRRRGEWEMTRVLRRFWSIDEAVLATALADEIPAEFAARPWPMAVKLAMVPSGGSPSFLQLYALNTMERAVTGGQAGIGPKDMHRVSGALDPFRMTALEERDRDLEACRAELAALGRATDGSRQGLEECRAVLAASRRRADDLEAEVALLRGSNSWRLTAPLRAVVGAIRGQGRDRGRNRARDRGRRQGRDPSAGS